MIGILNYNMGNLQSVKNSLDYLQIPNRFIETPAEISACDKLILPGVGAFGVAMEQLNKIGFIEPIKEFAQAGKPILGICLGMQLLLESSEEHGFHQGLGLVKGRVLFFQGKTGPLPIPSVGWNDIKKTGSSLLFEDLEDGVSFYFVHSYFCEMVDEKNIAATADYGVTFTASLVSKNIFGCQFHPEKSQQAGLKILENFNKII